ncbi:MAG: hypothetical protein DSM106950_30005 [Stigonema ocellatum SAG 48.90 = DSM 106950]|nr:hypothetical protein [Stigonema ocellatum SAG 48.90 = DSM 106950]
MLILDNKMYEESSENDLQEISYPRIIYKKFKQKAQDLIIEALFSNEELIFIKNETQSFPDDVEITEIIDCIAIQLGLSASWKFITKNIGLCVLLIKIDKHSTSLEPDEECYNCKSWDYYTS